jgi:hypothetical protein
MIYWSRGLSMHVYCYYSNKLLLMLRASPSWKDTVSWHFKSDLLHMLRAKGTKMPSESLITQRSSLKRLTDTKQPHIFKCGRSCRHFTHHSSLRSSLKNQIGLILDCCASWVLFCDWSPQGHDRLRIILSVASLIPIAFNAN